MQGEEKMPRSKKSRSRLSSCEKQVENKTDCKEDSESGPDTVITNLAASDDVSPLDKLTSLQDMFRGRVEPDVVHIVFQESGFNGILCCLQFL